MGAVSGLLLGGLTYLILVFAGKLPILAPYFINPKVPFLLAVIPNLILMRIWILNKQMESSGKGVLLISFLAIIAVFIFVK